MVKGITTTSQSTNPAPPSASGPIKVRYPNQDSPEQDCSLGVCNDESKCKIISNGGLTVQKTDCIPIAPYTQYAQYTQSNNPATPVAKGFLYGSKDPNAPKKCWFYSEDHLLTDLKKAGVPIPRHQWIVAPEYNMKGEKLDYTEFVCEGIPEALLDGLVGAWRSWVINTDPWKR